MKIIWVFCLLLFASCGVFDIYEIIEKEPHGDETIENELQGDWNWVKSTGGFIGETIHADSVDYEMSLTIEANGEAFWYRDGELIEEYTIKIGEEEWAEGKQVMYPKEEDSKEFKMQKIIDGVYNGELRLYDSCTDCYFYYFNR